MRGTTEQLFERYRSSGDASALASVLKRTGAELYRVARSMAGDDAEAEELLQETWLAALESRETWDGRRRLMPWLLGILANQFQRARQRARRARRELTSETPPDVPAPAREGPVHAASHNELSAALRKAIDQVREPFRTVLLMTLMQHRTPQEIAQELERSPVTVRGQLFRGAALLRRAIPAGFASGVVLSTQAMAAVQRVNTHVLEYASTLGTVASAATASSSSSTAAPPGTTGSFWTTKQAGLLIGGVVLTGLAVGLVWQVGSTPEVDQPSVAKETDLVGGKPAPEAPADRQLETTFTQSEEPTTTTRAVGGMELKLVWSSDQSPAQGVGLRLTPVGGDPRSGLYRAVSDADGVIRFADVPVGQYRAFSDRRFGFHARILANKTRHTKLSLPEDGVTVRGRVVDADGEAVFGAVIWHSETDSPDFGYHVAKSDPQGQFVLRGIPLGSLVGARSDLHSPSTLAEVEPRGGGTEVQLLLRLPGPAASLRGHVVDPEGKPVNGALVAVGARSGWWGNAVNRDSTGTGSGRFLVVTDAEGGFRLGGLPPGWAPLQVVKPGYRAWEAGASLDTSQPATVDVRLEPGLRLVGVVKSPQGTPVVNARVRLSDGRSLMIVTQRTDNSGRFVVDSLAAGRYQLEAATGPQRRVRKWVDVTADGPDGVELQLPPSVFLSGVLRHADGKPCKSWRLRLLTAEGGAGPKGDTDETGRFRVGPCRHGVDYAIYGQRLGQLGFQRCSPAQTFRPGTGAVEVRLPPETRSGSVRGRLLDGQERGMADARITVLQEKLASYEIAHATDAGGRFSLKNLPPGCYHLAFLAGRCLQVDARVQVDPGAVVDLGDVRPPGAGRLVVALEREDGEVPWNVHCFVTTLDAAGNPTWKELQMNYAAAVKGMSLPAGRYLLEIRGPETATRRQTVDIPKGHERSVKIVLPRAVSRGLVVCCPPGSPPPRRFLLRVVEESGRVSLEKRFSEEPFWAEVSWPPLPLGRHTVELELPTGRVLRGYVDIPDLQPRLAPLKVRLQ